jgi:hypothetical protein
MRRASLPGSGDGGGIGQASTNGAHVADARAFEQKRGEPLQCGNAKPSWGPCPISFLGPAWSKAWTQLLVSTRPSNLGCVELHQV